jgi:cell fate regulator YaaT (PSP1 superfamily)
MPILPLPQFEADLAEQDRQTYERLKPPSSVVVRFGSMKMVGEFPYDGDAKPGCGSKLVVRTHRGTELGEMLTSTCPNSGCSKSVSRKEMLQYIENSGGRDYPFFSMQGRVLRIATVEDLNEQARLDNLRTQMIMQAREIVGRLNLAMKIVDAEPILGQDRLTFYFASEDRIDFRELVNELAAAHKTRIEMRQVGARDEARLVADYEKCGQHCCCKQFLKVLKPISMKSAKIQKATLDPLKISGRCGRLMCCLRYEDETYDDLRKRLPKKKTRVATEHGPGIVLDTQILTQLVLVLLDGKDETVAVPVENISPEGTPLPARAAAPMADEDDDQDETSSGGVEVMDRPVQRAPAASPPPPRPARPQSGQPQQGGGMGGNGGGGGGGQPRPMRDQRDQRDQRDWRDQRRDDRGGAPRRDERGSGGGGGGGGQRQGDRGPRRDERGGAGGRGGSPQQGQRRDGSPSGPSGRPNSPQQQQPQQRAPESTRAHDDRADDFDPAELEAMGLGGEPQGADDLGPPSAPRFGPDGQPLPPPSPEQGRGQGGGGGGGSGKRRRRRRRRGGGGNGGGGGGAQGGPPPSPPAPPAA